MLDDLYQADTDAAINDLVRRPPAQKPQAAKFSAWSTLTAAPRGIGAGSNETAGGVADVLGAFGQVMGATDARSGGMFSAQTPTEQRQEEQARRKMLDKGLEFDAGDSFRSVAREWMPDATTAHTAERTVFDLFRFGTKAVTSTALAGPVAGPALTGLDEALTTADDLKRQGVDAETRMQVGAVSGVTAALGVALPVAGRNPVQTAALVAVGGPGSFIAQQAATRQILQDADYTKLADQIDPLDPVGLAVSTLVPAGFGVWAMRGMRGRAAEVKPGEPAPEVRPDAAPVQDAVQTEPARPRPTPDQVDAARVEMLTQHIEAAGLHSAVDARAAAMHLDAFARAMDDLSTGRRVDVSDLVPADRIQTARALDTFAARLDETRADLMAQAAMRAEPGAVRAMQSELLEAQARLTDLEDPAAIKARAGEIQQAERMSYKQALAQAKREFGAQADDMRARIARVESMLEDNATGQQAFDALNILDRQAADVGRQRSEIDAPATAETPVAQAVREITATRQEAAANVQDAPQARADAPATGARQPEPAAQPQTADARGAAPAGAAEQGGGVPRAGGRADAQADGVEPPAPGLVRVYHGGQPGAATGDVWFTRSLRDARGWAARGDGMVVEYVDVPESTFAADPEFGTLPSERLTLPASIASKRRPIQNQADGVSEDTPAARWTRMPTADRAGGGAPEAAVVAARLADVSQQFPDLTVQMDGMDAPMRLSDFLEQVKREAMDGTDMDIGGNDAPLMQVAASCFLLNGA